MRFLSIAAVMAVAASGAAFASPPAASSAQAQGCGFPQDAPIYGSGTAISSEASPVMVPLERGIVERGDKSNSLKAYRIPATSVSGWTMDYAMMRLSQLAGHPIWAETQDGAVGQTVTDSLPATTLFDAFDRLAADKGLRWRFDGQKVYILGGREWTIGMPSDRDLSAAVRDAIAKSGSSTTIDGGAIRFQADDAGAARASAIVAAVYNQPRLNPYDVTFYKVYPAKGAIDWPSLAERTDSVETVSFDGKAATLVLDPGSEDLIGAFLAREGVVRDLGSLTMVASTAGGSVSHAAGCGPQTAADHGLQLTGGDYDRGSMALRYAVLGGGQATGALSVAPGSVVVISDGVPDQGAYVVALVRPRVLELRGDAQTVQAAPVPPRPVAYVAPPVVATVPRAAPMQLPTARQPSPNLAPAMTPVRVVPVPASVVSTTTTVQTVRTAPVVTRAAVAPSGAAATRATVTTTKSSTSTTTPRIVPLGAPSFDDDAPVAAKSTSTTTSTTTSSTKVVAPAGAAPSR